MIFVLSEVNTVTVDEECVRVTGRAILTVYREGRGGETSKEKGVLREGNKIWEVVGNSKDH